MTWIVSCGIFACLYCFVDAVGDMGPVELFFKEVVYVNLFQVCGDRQMVRDVKRSLV